MTTFRDSGERSDFGTGAVRDLAADKGRFDLLPADAVRQLARVMETGCLKYGDRNWERGIPIRRYVDSALRHIFCVLAGQKDEPHLPMAAWNLMCAIQTEIWVRQGKLPSTLRDEWPFRIRLLETGDVEAFECSQQAGGGGDRNEPVAGPAETSDKPQKNRTVCQRCGGRKVGKNAI